MLFWMKPKRYFTKGLLSMDPMPVIKKCSIPYPSNSCYGTLRPLRYPISGENFDYRPLDDDLKCAICSEIFIEATTLNCSHTFCKYCIDRWRLTNVDCPICRAPVQYQVHTLVLDNLIEKILNSRSQEVRSQRLGIVNDRHKDLSTRKKYVQKPVQTVQLSNIHIGDMMLGSLLEALNEDDISSEMDDNHTICNWIALDPNDSSTDEYDDNYSRYSTQPYYS